MAKKRKTTNHYQVLGIENFANSDQAAAAYARLQQQYNNLVNPSPQEIKDWGEVQEAFNVLFTPIAKEEYDNQLSAFLSLQQTKKPSATPKINPKVANIAIIGVFLLGSAVYFFKSKNDYVEPSTASPIIKPIESSEGDDSKQEQKLPQFLTDFANESSRQRSASLYLGLLGAPEIHESVSYPVEAFLAPIQKNPLGNDFPQYSGVLRDFPSYSFGDVKFTLKNPSAQNAFIKILYLDENENYVIRHAYILANDQITLSGLPEGAVQVAVLFPAFPQIAFLTQQYKLYPDIENEMFIYGQKAKPNELF